MAMTVGNVQRPNPRAGPVGAQLFSRRPRDREGKGEKKQDACRCMMVLGWTSGSDAAFPNQIHDHDLRSRPAPARITAHEKLTSNPGHHLETNLA
jgi:hypothetical protein